MRSLPCDGLIFGRTFLQLPLRHCFDKKKSRIDKNTGTSSTCLGNKRGRSGLPARDWTYGVNEAANDSRHWIKGCRSSESKAEGVSLSVPATSIDVLAYCSQFKIICLRLTVSNSDGSMVFGPGGPAGALDKHRNRIVLPAW